VWRQEVWVALVIKHIFGSPMPGLMKIEIDVGEKWLRCDELWKEAWKEKGAWGFKKGRRKGKRRVDDSRRFEF
jgi:hypothetical protein